MKILLSWIPCISKAFINLSFHRSTKMPVKIFQLQMYPAYDIWSPPEEDQKLHSESEA